MASDRPKSQIAFSERWIGPSTARVLVVDDDAALLEAVSGMITLRFPQASVEKCASAGVAFQQLATRPYDVVLSDLRMPGVEGLMLVELIQQFWPQTPVIVMTGDPLSQAAADAKTRGAFRVLAKPLDRDVLTAALHEALGTRRAA
jgi:DNA-binding NtrC family response regulator